MPSFLTPLPRAPSSAYGLFISHAWDYADDYEGIIRLLDGDTKLKWKNLSIPIENPIQMSAVLPKSNRRIVKELEARIKLADCLLVLAGMYVRHSAWIQSEIEIAHEFGKPMIGVKPQGQERIPIALQSFACELVGWTTESIVSAVRRHAKPTQSLRRLYFRPRKAALTPPSSSTIPGGIGADDYAWMTSPTTTKSVIPSGSANTNTGSDFFDAALRATDERE